MELIKIRNPHQGLPEIVDRIQRIGIERDSRYGRVVMFKEPVTLVYEKPIERVVFWAERDANPFFHLFESLWMLAGRNDAAFLTQFVKRMIEFSDNKVNFHAAYGFRWRKHFVIDQLNAIIENLKKNKDCRRQVLGIWDVKQDLSKIGVDIPCNLEATFQINHEGKLDMVVHNRSGDAIMGALGANVVHFSILQEYIANSIGVPMGRYWQVSSNLHVYLNDMEKFQGICEHVTSPYRSQERCPYVAGEVTTTPIIDIERRQWDKDLHTWLIEPFKVGISSKFFLRVATPMYAAHLAHREKDYAKAIEIVETQMPAQSDWKKAAKEWLQRREKKHEA